MIYFVSGTNLGDSYKNYIYVSKMTQLCKTYYDDD